MSSRACGRCGGPLPDGAGNRRVFCDTCRPLLFYRSKTVPNLWHRRRISHDKPSRTWRRNPYGATTEQEYQTIYRSERRSGPGAIAYRRVPLRRFERLAAHGVLLPTFLAEPRDEGHEAAELRAAVHRVLDKLAYREREVLKLRYGIGYEYTYTYDDIARIFKRTRECVRQIEARALRKLRHSVRARGLLEVMR